MAELARIPEGFSSLDEFIGYCETHCETPRALFAAEHIHLMIALAGEPKGYPYGRYKEGAFYSMHDEMEYLCRTARACIAEGEAEAKRLGMQPAPSAALPKRGQVYAHHKGGVYTVLGLANEAHPSDKFPVTVIYVGANGNCWARPLSEWHGKYTLLHDGTQKAST